MKPNIGNTKVSKRSGGQAYDRSGVLKVPYVPLTQSAVQCPN